MPRTADELAAEAMQLPVSSRVELVEQIIESFDPDESSEVQQAWAEEAIRRREEVRSVRSAPIRIEL